MQAETRVNAEQASKRAMWEPTRLKYGEGRSFQGPESDAVPGSPTGVLASACMEEEIDRNTGSPSGLRA
jgi:hypothetical protein